MSELQNVELIKSGYAAFTRGDIQALIELFSEDLDFSILCRNDLAVGGQAQRPSRIRGDSSREKRYRRV
jgi:ketosteroid isomerase-like protein